MAIGTLYQTRLTPDQVRGVKGAMGCIDEARAYVEAAAAALPITTGFGNEHAKLLRSAEGLKWERNLIDERLNELLDRGKRVSDCCSKCGCALPLAARTASPIGAAACEYCGH